MVNHASIGKPICWGPKELPISSSQAASKKREVLVLIAMAVQDPTDGETDDWVVPKIQNHPVVDQPHV